eukprot:GGOE01009649.1.p1 GENE.GGOE01009649.1~~GGOE01009649.1.p1  ORF type:complete len:266 (-),score=47.15 GGOE01009649.1:176-973(-)
MNMRRAVTLVGRSLNGFRNYATPSAKYIQIYESDFARNQYPLELLGGAHVDFAKLLYTFADQCENKRYEFFLEDFKKLDNIISKQGPFWGEENFFQSPVYSNLTEGFKFILGWIQSEGAIDRLENVRAAYKELVNEVKKETTATIIVAKETRGSELSEIQSQVEAIHKESSLRGYKLVVETKVDPSIGGGYILEVCNQVVNRSAAAAAAESAALEKASAAQVDWTSLPATPPRPSPSHPDTLIRLLGSVVDDLAEADKAEQKYGA